MKVYVIIETDKEGVYQSSEVIADEDIANETLERYRTSKKGFMFNYRLEVHYL